ncbi:MAG TPA: hypothetical protein V6C57_07940 [Coleofasciculaceae cyanobacterium]
MRTLAALNTAAVFWLTTIGLALWLGDAAWRSPAAWAYTSESNITLQQEPNETYEGLTRRAELAARAAAQRSFDSDILITTVSVTVLGESGRAIVPILVLEVSRTDWRNRPDPQYWAKYFRTARPLLDLESPNSDQTSQPTAQPTVITPAPPASPASPATPLP